MAGFSEHRHTVRGGLGYLMGKTAPLAADPLVQALQEPMTIVEASAFIGDEPVAFDGDVDDIDAKQLALSLIHI